MDGDQMHVHGVTESTSGQGAHLLLNITAPGQDKAEASEATFPLTSALQLIQEGVEIVEASAAV